MNNDETLFTKLRTLSLAFLLAIGGAGMLSGCEEQGPVEEAGETIDEAAEDAGEAIDEGVEDAEDALQ